MEHGSQLNNKKNESVCISYYNSFLNLDLIICVVQQKPTMQMDAQRKKERERIQKEIDKLKESIQTLTKS